MRFLKVVILCWVTILSFLTPHVSIVSAHVAPSSVNHISSGGYQYKVLSGSHHVSGTRSALVILVGFQDVQPTASVQSIRDVAIDQLNAYYHEVSYGQITITGQVFGWYTLGHRMGYYGNDSSKPGDDSNVAKLGVDALAQLPSSLDTSTFNYLVVVHAGQDQAHDQYDKLSDEIWSRSYSPVFPSYKKPNEVTFGSKSFTIFAILSEFDGVGAFAHEWGHMLGLPDLYDEASDNSYVGYWSLMDSGDSCCYNEAQSTPSYVGGWSAVLLGWLTPTVADPNVLVSSFELQPLETAGATTILVPVSNSTYYFIEERSQIGEDSHLPGSGVLVYYVNENLDTGKGILRLVNPKTGQLYPAVEHEKELNGAVFNLNDRFEDTSHNVYLAFLGSSNSMTALYSHQALTASIVTTSLRSSGSAELSGTFNDVLTVSVALMQNGLPFSGQSVELEVLNSSQWQKLATTTTDALGGASVSISLQYPVGQHEFRFLYLGGKGNSAWYTSSDYVFSVEIRPAIMSITITQGLSLTQTAVTVTATDVQGRPLYNVLVTLVALGITQATASTKGNGQAILPIQFPFANFGPQNITVKASLANYQLTSNSVNVFVIPFWLVILIIAIPVAVIVAIALRRRKGQPKITKAEKVDIDATRLSTKAIENKRYCIECGNELHPNLKFCDSCGTKQP